MSRQIDPPSAPPQYSPDGRWWWNGTEWVAVTGLRQQPPQAQPRRPRAVWIVAIVAALVGFLVLGLLALAMVTPIGSQMESDPEFDRFYCETFPEDC